MNERLVRVLASAVVVMGCSGGGSSGGGAGGAGGGSGGSSASGGVGGGSGPCAGAGESLCGDVCVNLSVDDDNCGACGVSCGLGSCESGQCDCAPSALSCGGTCIDVTTDPTNCGACAHSCLGQPCVERACVPETLVKSPEAISVLAADATTLYFASLTTLYSAPQSGGQPTTLGTLTAHPVAIAVGSSDVYVALKATDVVRIPKTGGAAVTVAAATTPLALEAANGKLYWSGDLNGNAGIIAMDESGGAPALIAPETYRPSHMALTPTKIVYRHASELVSVDLNGTNRELIAPLVSSGGTVAVETSATHAFIAAGDYWDQLDFIAGTVKSVPLAGGELATLDTDDMLVMASDEVQSCWSTAGKWTYCLDHGAAAKRLIAKTGGGQAILLTEDYAILVDKTGTQAGMTISRVAH